MVHQHERAHALALAREGEDLQHDVLCRLASGSPQTLHKLQQCALGAVAATLTCPLFIVNTGCRAVHKHIGGDQLLQQRRELRAPTRAAGLHVPAICPAAAAVEAEGVVEGHKRGGVERRRAEAVGVRPANVTVAVAGRHRRHRPPRAGPVQPVALHAKAAAAHPQAHHTHRVLGQRAGLVGADGRCACHRLACVQMAHEVVVLEHALDAERQRKRDRKRQALRHRHHQHSHTRDEVVQECLHIGNIHDVQPRVLEVQCVAAPVDQQHRARGQYAKVADLLRQLVQLVHQEGAAPREHLAATCGLLLGVCAASGCGQRAGGRVAEVAAAVACLRALHHHSVDLALLAVGPNRDDQHAPETLLHL
mmetsp:Transcript_14580/g.42639  ORF Transcript_14580/g.42639 Transcript_14580/m.42639 type:complete len:364 (-) Transcript_14580:1478-2569(-)